MIKSNYPVDYFNKKTGKYPSIGIDCMNNENEVPANAAVVPSDSRVKRGNDSIRPKPTAEGLIMAVNSLNDSIDEEDSQHHQQQFEDGEVNVDDGQNEPEDLGLCGTDSSQSPQISPSNGQINSMPLCSITNKLINSKPFDFSYNANNFNYQNYYNGSVSLTPNSLNSSSYDNHHFANNANPYSATSFNVNSGHHFAQQQQFTNNSFQNQLNQYNQSNPLAYLNNQAQQQAQTAQQRINNTNNRASTGSSSADTSSASLSSPPLSSGSENVSPLMALNPNTNQMMIQNASQLSKYYNSPFNLKSNGPVAATPVSANTANPSIRSNMPANMIPANSQDGSEGSLPLKKRRPVPSECKDNSYWEKRRKNNESAKRSRDMRRSKEEHISMRVVFLENENLHLRTECGMLRKEVEQLRAMLYANTNVNH